MVARGHGTRHMARRLLLINPNTSEPATVLMTAMARDSAPVDVEIVGATVASGPPLLADPDALSAAAVAVLDWLANTTLEGFDGVVIAAFGDPGLETARQRLRMPVTGIGEAAMAEAAGQGRRFAIVTTTPAMAGAITDRAIACGYRDQFLGVYLTPGDPAALMSRPEQLTDALELACHKAIEHAGAEAIVIGGGPLAQAARELRRRFSPSDRLVIVEPVPAAIRMAVSRIPE